ncbi:hypothetical protein KI387_019933, partial [Taxus chinensis]
MAMATYLEQGRASYMLPRFQYSSSSSLGALKRPFASDILEKIAIFSQEFYAACSIVGIISCGLTHTAVTPLDLVKCNMQINPAKYKSIATSFGVLLKEGAR